MAVLTEGVIKKLQSHLKSSGYTGVVTIGEPQKPPDGWHASISLVSSEPNPGEETTLTGTVEIRTITISIRRAVLAETPEHIEIRLDEILGKLHAELMGNYTLDGSIRNIMRLSWVCLYEQIPTGGAEYRVARMTVPCIVDDSATLAP